MGQESDGAQTKKSDRHHNGVLLERHRDLLHLRGRSASHGERQGCPGPRPVQVLPERLDEHTRCAIARPLVARTRGNCSAACAESSFVWSLRCACLVAAVWSTRGKSSATLVCLLRHAVRAGWHSSEVVQRTFREALPGRRSGIAAGAARVPGRMPGEVAVGALDRPAPRRCRGGGSGARDRRGARPTLRHRYRDGSTRSVLSQAISASSSRR